MNIDVCMCTKPCGAMISISVVFVIYMSSIYNNKIYLLNNFIVHVLAVISVGAEQNSQLDTTPFDTMPFDIDMSIASALLLYFLEILSLF